MKTQIELDTKTIIRFWAAPIVFMVTVAVILFLVYSARMALVIIGASIFFAIALSPPVNFLAKKFPSKSRVFSTAIAYIAVLSVLGLIIFLVVPPIVNQTIKFTQAIPELVDSATRQYSGVNLFLDKYNLQPEFTKFLSSIKDGTAQFAANIGSTLINSLGSFLSTIAATILLLVLTFLMLVESPHWLKHFWSIYDDKELLKSHQNIVNRMYTVVTSYVNGQLLISSIAGFVAGVSVFILGIIFDIPINLSIPAAAIIFTLSLIPLFGEITGSLIVGLILALNNVTAAIIFVIFFILYAQIEANMLAPKIHSKRINLPALAILLSVTIGIYMFGIVGAIISIPIAGCLRVLFEEYATKAKNKIIDVT